MSKLQTIIAAIGICIAGAVALVEEEMFRGRLVVWLWSLTGLEPMPPAVGLTIAIVVVAIAFLVIGAVVWHKNGDKS